MAERKNKGASENVHELHKVGILHGPMGPELGSGYTLAVHCDENERPVVDIKTYGQVDVARLRREIGRFFPNVQIRHKEELHTVVLIGKNTKKLVASKKSSVEDQSPQI